MTDLSIRGTGFGALYTVVFSMVKRWNIYLQERAFREALGFGIAHMW